MGGVFHCELRGGYYALEDGCVMKSWRGLAVGVLILMVICLMLPQKWYVCGMCITKYGSTLYIGMDEVLAHYACTFENSNMHFHFQ